MHRLPEHSDVKWEMKAFMGLKHTIHANSNSNRFLMSILLQEVQASSHSLGDCAFA